MYNNQVFTTLNSVNSQGIQPHVFTEVEVLKQHLLDNSVNPDAAKYQYLVPELGEGGSCSLFGALQDDPYCLKEILTGHVGDNNYLLARLQQIVDYVIAETRADWFGIYQARVKSDGEQVLVKLAYFGEPSRAEFPLNKQFAEISNNVKVGLSGVSNIVNNVAEYIASGGEYYTCDPKVQSEVCMPIFNPEGDIVGITDTEAFSAEFFDQQKIAILAAANIVIASLLPA